MAPTMLETAVQTDPTLLRYASAITELAKEMLGVAGSKVWPFSNFAQQLPTKSNNMQQGLQMDATCNIQQCCILLQGD